MNKLKQLLLLLDESHEIEELEFSPLNEALAEKLVTVFGSNNGSCGGNSSCSHNGECCGNTCCENNGTCNQNGSCDIDGIMMAM